MEAPLNYFSELYRVDVSKHIEKKSGYSYVSWPFAVAELRKRHPDATWEVVRFNGMPYLTTPAGHFVEVAVCVNGVRLSQIHPVLNGANKPIKEPNAFDINTSLQRALVKAIALHGLGLFVYAGEDLPEDDKQAKKELHSIGAVVDETTASELDNVVLDMLDMHDEGRDLQASRVYYGLEDNEHKAYVWERLKPHSKLRAIIKANSPHKEAA